MKLLIVDTETTGLDPSIHQVVELGAILYDVESQSAIHQLSLVFPSDGNEAEDINRIPASLLQGLKWNDQALAVGLSFFTQLVDCADYMIAHNAAFDRQWFDGDLLPKVSLQWLCTKEDFNLVPDGVSKALYSIAYHRGLPVYEEYDHRALSDCMTISRIFDKCQNLREMVEYAARPKQLYWANVPFSQKDLAKDAGFVWDKLITKKWAKRLTPDEVASLCFPVVLVEDSFVF